MKINIIKKLLPAAILSVGMITITSCRITPKKVSDNSKASGLSSLTENGSDSSAFSMNSDNGAYSLDFELFSGLSEKYVDFNNRAFAYNGKLFKLGENTIGDLMNAGMEFTGKKFETAFLDYELIPNEQSAFFTCKVNSEVYVTVQGMNLTDDMQLQKDSVLIYFELGITDTIRDDTPDEKQELILNDVKEANDLFRFSFPLDLRIDNLLEKFPDTTENDGKGGVTYLKDAVDNRWNSFIFRFDEKTGILNFFSISWLPDLQS